MRSGTVNLIISMLSLSGITALSTGCTNSSFSANSILNDLGMNSGSSADDRLRSGNTSSFIFCANEYGSCSFSGTRNVRYGTATQYVTLVLSNGTLCDNSVFGDPATGANKQCSYSSSTVTVPAPSPTPTPAPAPAPALPIASGGTGLVQSTFSTSTEDFLNPERGWYINPTASEFVDVGTLTGFVTEWHTRQFMMREDLGPYRTQALPQSYLIGLNARLAGVRASGTKVILSFAYDWSGSGGDTTLNWVQTHASQLKSILAANEDVISHLRAGFIGSWGEWAINSLIDSKASKRAVKDAVMDMTPPSIPVEFTQLYPPMEDWFAGQGPLSASEAYSGSVKSRIGFHSDCFLTGNGDSYFYTGAATVVDFNITSSRAQQRSYLEATSQYMPFGGELCVDSQGSREQQRMACSASYDFEGNLQSGGIMVEGPKYHLTFLGYPAYALQPIKDSWVAGGCYDQVSRLMGYRFQLDAISHPQAINRGQSMDVNIELRNLGWARIYSARKLVVTLKHRATGALMLGSAGDARQFPPQATSSTRQIVNVSIPSGAAVGDYDVYVSMPDIFSSLANDPRYSVRFGNSDDSAKGQAFDAASGRFKVGTMIKVQ